MSEIPCRLNVGVHEGLTSPPLSLLRTRRIYHPGAKAWDSYRVAETPWSFTATCRCVVAWSAERTWEPSKPSLRGRWRRNWNTTLSGLRRLPVKGDSDWRAVWLGRHPDDKESSGLKGYLRRVRTPPQRARPKGSLTGFCTMENPGTKVGPSEPPCLSR
jgi:hypothetical protein